MDIHLFQEPQHFVFKEEYDGGCFYIRLIQSSDLELTHGWVNKTYARKFWQMQGSLEKYVAHYLSKEMDKTSRTFILCHLQTPIALFEVYQVLGSELAFKVNASESDYGIHLLMAPHSELLPLKRNLRKVSRESLKTILNMLFSYSAIERIFAEPDSQNYDAHKLAEGVGFDYIGDIQLSDKKAKLYVLSKKKYLNSGD